MKQSNVIYDGNSLTSGDGGAAVTYPYPTQVAQLLGFNYKMTNKGVVGQTTRDMSADYASDIAPLYSASIYANNVLVAWEGGNDMVAGQTPAQAYANLVSYCGLGRATGFKIIILTVTYRSTSPSTFNTNVDTLNGLLRTNWASFADAIVDVGANTNFQTPLNTTSFFNADLIHMLNGGYGIVASMVRTGILSVV